LGEAREKKRIWAWEREKREGKGGEGEGERVVVLSRDFFVVVLRR